MQWDATDVLKRLVAFFFPDRQTVQVFLLSIFVLLTIFSAGFYLNDEMEQGTSFYNLLQGDLTIEEIPEEYYVSQSGIRLNPRFQEYGGHRYIAASHGMSVFSLPFYYTLAAADAVMGVEVFFVVLWSVSLGAFLYLSSGCIARCIRTQWPDAVGVEKKIRWLPVAAPAVLLGVNLWLLQPFRFELWGPPIAMQFMSLVFVALGLAVLFRFLRYVFSERLAFFGSFFLLVASPVAFWAIGQKYHGLNFALLVFAFASFCYGKKAGRWRYCYGGYVFASLAIWVQLYSGVVILLSLLLVDILSTKRRRLLNLAAILFIVMLSLGPYFIENYVIFDNPLYPGYIAKGNRNVIPPDPPEISMLSPVTGAYISGIVPVQYNVSGNTDESLLRYSRDGKNWTVLQKSWNHSVSFTWNTSRVADGLGILNVAARTWRGDRAARNVSVVVDNAPPNISFLSPNVDSVVTGNVTIRCNLSSDVALIDYYYSRNGNTWIWLGNDSTPYDGFSWNTSGLQGTYQLKATAVDHVGYRNTSQIWVAVDNSGEHLIIRQPAAGTYIAGRSEIDSVAPPGTTRIEYAYLVNESWQLLGVDDTPETSFEWNTQEQPDVETVLRATAFRDSQIIETVTNHNITIDNQPPDISLIKPLPGEKVRDVTVISYITSNNTAGVEVSYTQNEQWTAAGIDHAATEFMLDTSNLSGIIRLRVTARSRTGLNDSAFTSIEIIEDGELSAIGRFSFIINSLDVGWEFMKRVSAVGEPGDIVGNLYKSFFNARGTEASFAFFVFTPFLILALFAPFVYLRKKRQFGLIDGLMVSYIVIHLFIFVNISIYQGGGYDMRWYLPLHLPFLFFGLIAFEKEIIRQILTIVKTYVLSLIVLFPLFLFVDWITTLNIHPRGVKLDHFFSVNRIFSDAVLVVLLFLSVIYLANKLRLLQLPKLGIGLDEHIETVWEGLIGIALFTGTLMLALTMVLYSRGIPLTFNFNDNNGVFTLFIPILKYLQEFLQNIL